MTGSTIDVWLQNIERKHEKINHEMTFGLYQIHAFLSIMWGKHEDVFIIKKHFIIKDTAIQTKKSRNFRIPFLF